MRRIENTFADVSPVRHYLHRVTDGLFGPTVDDERTRLVVLHVASNATEEVHEGIEALFAPGKGLQSFFQRLLGVERRILH